MSWTCPICERELRTVNHRHYCEKVSLDSLFEGKAEELEYVFDKILAEVTGWEDVLVSTTKNCIVFVHNKAFLIIRPMKKQLNLKIYSDKEPEKKIKSIFSSGKNYETHLRVATLEDLNSKVFGLIRKSYELQ